MLPVNSAARKRLENRALSESEITNFNQCAALAEAVIINAALEKGASSEEEMSEALFAQAQTIAEALRNMHELIQALA